MQFAHLEGEVPNNKQSFESLVKVSLLSLSWECCAFSYSTWLTCWSHSFCFTASSPKLLCHWVHCSSLVVQYSWNYVCFPPHVVLGRIPFRTGSCTWLPSSIMESQKDMCNHLAMCYLRCIHLLCRFSNLGWPQPSVSVQFPLSSPFSSSGRTPWLWAFIPFWFISHIRDFPRILWSI